MEERSTQAGAAERPIGGTDGAPGGGESHADARGPAHLADPRALTILTTEHWSLLTARSLVYNEAFARAGMFLTFLTGSLVALGFVSQASGFGQEFLVVATALLGADVLIGLATLGRISSASAEEFRALQGMNRLRHAYLEMVPSLDPYFSTSSHDDLAGVLHLAGATPDRPFLGSNVLHGLTTAPGLVGMITALAGGGFMATLALLLGGGTVVAIVAGFAAILVLFGVMTIVGVRTFERAATTLEVRFPPSAHDAEVPPPPSP